MRNFSYGIFFLLVMLLLSGCATSQPDVRIVHVAVAPEDNLLVDCDVAPPPAKTEYLAGFKTDAPYVAAPVMPSSGSLPYDNISYVAQYVQALAKKAEERERLLTNLNLKNYQNLDLCNERWAALRVWKTNSLKVLGNQKKE